jgi:cytoskeletal protein RodZ
MKQQDWTDELRQRLSDYEEPVPEGLWDDIEQRIQRRPRLVVLRRWMAGAAAVALLLVGGWQLLSPSDGIESTAEEALLAQAEDMESPEPPSSNVTQQEATASATSTALPEHRTLSTQRGGTTETTPVATPSQETTQQDVSSQETTQQDASSQETTRQDAPSQETTRQETPSQETTQQETQSQETTQQQETAPTGNNGTRVNPTNQRVEPTRRLPRKAIRSPFSLQLHATNLMAYNSGTSQTEPMLMNRAYMGPASSALARTAPVYLSNHEDKYEHHMPLTVGLSLRLPIDEQWWLNSGINYSRVTSTFNHQIGSITQVNDQRLHYLGVPLMVGYSFWQKPSLKAYVSTGAEAQYNLKAEVDNGHLNRDRMQFSLLGSAGIEYTFLPQLSIYVQPGLRYYPDNGSHVQNIFKERPLQFDLQLGIRYSLR